MRRLRKIGARNGKRITVGDTAANNGKRITTKAAVADGRIGKIMGGKMIGGKVMGGKVMGGKMMGGDIGPTGDLLMRTQRTHRMTATCFLRKPTLDHIGEFVHVASIFDGIR